MNQYKFLILSIFLMSLVSRGQINTYSPYSYFALGIVHPSVNANNFSMGGLAITVSDNQHLNYLNPATYSFLDETSFEVGVKSSFSNMSQDNLNQKNFTSGLANMGLGFPVSKKMGFSLALLPYSSVGYDLTTESIIENAIDSIQATYNYHGSGGLNKLLFGFSYKVRETGISNLSMGLNLNYLFGVIERETTIFTDNSSNYFRDKTDVILNGFNFEIGALYSVLIFDDKLGLEDYKINWGFSIKNKANLKSKINTLQSTYDGPDYDSTSDDTSVLYEAIDEQANDVALPYFYSMGISLEDNKKWLIGLDYNFNTAYSNILLSHQHHNMRSYDEYILGGFFTPNKADIYNYFNRIQYRFGLSYGSGFLDIGGVTNGTPEKLKNFSASFGLGLPITKASSTANIGVKYGVVGNTSNTSAINEKYVNLYLSMTLNEKWFNKRKIQ